MNATNLSDDELPVDYVNMLNEEKELRELMWSQLTVDEKVLILAYTKQIQQNKVAHSKMVLAVLAIEEKYTGFYHSDFIS